MSTKKIGIWAGSSVATKALFNEGLNRLKKLGMLPVIPSATKNFAFKGESKARPFLAGPDAKKAKAFVELWKRKDISDILCVRGGYGCIRLLPHLDRIPLGPTQNKRVWGFSDLTTLQNYLFQRTGAPWIHSPMLTSPSFLDPKGSEKPYWKDVFSPMERSTHVLKVLNNSPKIGQSFSGPLLGGNLACFNAMLGTPWEPRPKKEYFLFLEDLNEKAYKVDRLLQQLSASEVLNNCRGIILGHFTDCQNAVEVATLWAKENGIFLMSGLNAGHDRPNLPIPMGVAVDFSRKSKGAIILTVPKPHW